MTLLRFRRVGTLLLSCMGAAALAACDESGAPQADAALPEARCPQGATTPPDAGAIARVDAATTEDAGTVVPLDAQVQGVAPDRDAGGVDAAVSVAQGRMPEYDAEGRLKRVPREEWERWIMVGAGLNMSYSPFALPGEDVYTTVYIEPSAYDYFKQHGEFREGTMTVLPVYRAHTSEPPLTGGSFAAELSDFEMSVKDSSRLPEEVWGYYRFGLDGQLAEPQPALLCHDCHAQNAETDFVFTQFYPALP